MPASSKGDTPAHDSVEWNGITFPFVYCRSRRRTIAITVRPDRSLSVRAPLRTPPESIRSFVICKAPWIVRVWGRMDARPPHPAPSFTEGSPVLFQGIAYPLAIREGTPASIGVSDGRLLLTHPAPEPAAIIRMIGTWYRRQARELIPQRAAHCHRLMQQEGFSLPPLTIRPMKSRWGSYSYRTGRVCLNLHLLKAPPECLDYVIIHELCHIRVRHHGPDFWALVERYAPDYRAARQLLKAFPLA